MLELQGHQAPILTLTFGPDGQQLVSGDSAGILWLWNLHTGQGEMVGAFQPLAIISLAISPEGHTLAIGQYHQITLWDLGDHTALSRLECEHHGTYNMLFLPDGKHILICSYLNATFDVYAVETGQKVNAIPGADLRVMAMACSTKGPWLVAGGGATRGGRLGVWDHQRGGLVRLCEQLLSIPVMERYGWPNYTIPIQAAHANTVLAVALSPDDRLLVSGGRDGYVHVWERCTGKLLHTFSGHKGAVVAAAFTLDGQRVLSASSDGVITLWEVALGRAVQSWDWKLGRLHSVRFAAHGMTAAAGAGNTVLLWDMDN